MRHSGALAATRMAPPQSRGNNDWQAQVYLYIYGYDMLLLLLLLPAT